jgi:peptidoglycan LD-endopeptidase CwlK
MSHEFNVAKHLARVALYDLKAPDTLMEPMRSKVIELMRIMKEKGMPVQIVWGFRTAKQQDEMYAKGRTTTGSIVTNARGLESYHNFGSAIDLISLRDGWNAPYYFWNTLGEEGKKLGLIWGGDWSDFPDKAHFESHEGWTWEQMKQYFKS